MRELPLPPVEVRPKSAGASAAGAPAVSYLEGVAVVLQYDSVFDVHTPPDPENYPNLRAQPGAFDTLRILNDLAGAVDGSLYDFVLLYSLREVPNWINSGYRFQYTPARNIGQWNADYGVSAAPDAWPRLRSVPHMNDLAFNLRSSAFDNIGSLTAFHEMYHLWGVMLTRNPGVGPRQWVAGEHPVGWLANCCGHWSYAWDEPGQPGIMYSSPLSPRFNEFDLYVLGLMEHDEAAAAVHTVVDETGTQHTVTLADMREALALDAPGYYGGDGKRVPALDPSVADLNVLIVIVRGADDELTETDRQLVREMAEDLPRAWQEATWGRSRLGVPSVGCAAGVLPPAVTISVDRPGDAAVITVHEAPMPGEVRVYNIFRGQDPSTPATLWPVAAADVGDADPSMPLVQWVDDAVDPPAGRLWLYQVTAVDPQCAAEGPF